VRKGLGFLIALLPLFLLFGCARFQNALPEEIVLESYGEELAVEEPYAEEPAVEEAVEALEPRFVIIPPNARPGEPITIGYSYNFYGDREFLAVLLDSRGRRIARAAFFRLNREEDEAITKAAVLAIPSTALIGDAHIRIESGDDIIRDIPFTIDHREFHSETIALSQANTDLRTRQDPERVAEAQHLWAILNRTGNEIFTSGPFESPVTSTRRTSLYGGRRVFQYADGRTDTTIHAGVDFGVPTGTEVRASAAGRVALARWRIITGYSVILEHMPGLYSLYYHLDSIAVSEGSVVEAGTPIGESGATGLATGPHLHWEIRVSGENADPDAFMYRPILDKNAIIDKLTAY
jgi:murein DD-endopeptidase MepM/ murein hydrolase activator NlpD